MIRGATRSFLRGSRCTIIAHEHEHAREIVIVMSLSATDSRRWVCQLLSGETTLADDNELAFESYHSAAVALQADGSDWLQASIADPGHYHCTPSLKVAVAASGGVGLYAQSCIKAKAVALSEPVNMIARCSEDGSARWDVYKAALKCANKSSATAFDALPDAGLVERHREQASQLFESQALASLPPEYSRVLLEDALICEREAQRIAGCLARWQANGHDFQLRGEREKCSAVYNLAARLQHSCEPNVRRPALDIYINPLAP